MKWLRHLEWLIPVLLIGYVAGQAVLATKVLVYQSDLTKRTAGLGILLPEGRVSKELYGIHLEQEPVYLDVRLPPRTETVSLSLTVNQDSPAMAILARVGAGWNYLKLPVEIKPVAGGRLVYKVTVSQLGFVGTDYYWRFLLSVPDLDKSNLVIYRAQADITRRPWFLNWRLKQ